ncbi:MAG: hypothetical protein ACRELE_02270, partial [Gemmatimonadales bacterium]
MRVQSKVFVPAFAAMFFGVVASDVTGVWRGQATDAQGNVQELVVTLSVQGNQLSGTLAPRTGAPTLPIVNGKSDGDHITFEALKISPQGDTARFVIAATVTGDRMTGTAIGPRGDTARLVLDRVARVVPPPAGAPERSDPKTSAPPNPKGRNPVPTDAQQAILTAFDRYAIVGGLG